LAAIGSADGQVHCSVCGTTDKRRTIEYPCGMSKIDQYRVGYDLCAAKAAKAASGELREIWRTLGSSYAFLIELESRPGDVFGVPAPLTSIPGSGDPLGPPPAGGRIPRG
jgi:hypothetical protein